MTLSAATPCRPRYIGLFPSSRGVLVVVGALDNLDKLVGPHGFRGGGGLTNGRFISRDTMVFGLDAHVIRLEHAMFTIANFETDWPQESWFFYTCVLKLKIRNNKPSLQTTLFEMNLCHLCSSHRPRSSVGEDGNSELEALTWPKRIPLCKWIAFLKISFFSSPYPSQVETNAGKRLQKYDRRFVLS